MIISSISASYVAAAEKITFSKIPLTIQSTPTTELIVELAISESQQEHGLMFRKKLGEKEGMLFVFASPRHSQMWMKNTLITLDMIFIDENNRIESIAENTTPQSEAIISSQGAVKAVLELRGGAAKKHAIKVGDEIIYTLPH